MQWPQFFLRQFHEETVLLFARDFFFLTNSVEQIVWSIDQHPSTSMDGCSVEPKSVVSREKRDRNGLHAIFTESTGDENARDMFQFVLKRKFC